MYMNTIMLYDAVNEIILDYKDQQSFQEDNKMFE